MYADKLLHGIYIDVGGNAKGTTPHHVWCVSEAVAKATPMVLISAHLQVVRIIVEGELCSMGV